MLWAVLYQHFANQDIQPVQVNVNTQRPVLYLWYANDKSWHLSLKQSDWWYNWISLAMAGKEQISTMPPSSPSQIWDQALFRAEQFYWGGQCCIVSFQYNCCIVSLWYNGLNLMESHTSWLPPFVTFGNLKFCLHVKIDIMHCLSETSRKFPCQIAWSWIWFGSLWHIIYGSLVHCSAAKMIPNSLTIMRGWEGVRRRRIIMTGR